MSALKPGVLWYRARTPGVLAIGQGFLQVAPLPQADDARAAATACWCWSIRR